MRKQAFWKNNFLALCLMYSIRFYETEEAIRIISFLSDPFYFKSANEYKVRNPPEMQYSSEQEVQLELPKYFLITDLITDWVKIYHEGLNLHG